MATTYFYIKKDGEHGILIIRKKHESGDMMRIEQLEYFLEIIKEESMNKAAKNLFLTQPALSAAITALEKELGFALFYRTKQGLKLTKNGKKIYQDSIAILRYVSEWKLLKQNEDEIITVSSIPSLSNSILSYLLFDINKQFSVLEIKLKTSYWSEVINDLQSQKSQIGLVAIASNMSKEYLQMLDPKYWQYKLMHKGEYRLILSKEHPLAQKEKIFLSDMKEYTLVIHHSEIRYHYQEVISKKYFDNVIQVENDESILYMVEKNMGVSIHVDIALQEIAQVNSGKIVSKRFSDFPTPLDYYMIYPGTHYLSKNCENTIMQIQQIFDDKIKKS